MTIISIAQPYVIMYSKADWERLDLFKINNAELCFMPLQNGLNDIGLNEKIKI